MTKPRYAYEHIMSTTSLRANIIIIMCKTKKTLFHDLRDKEGQDGRC